MYRLRQMHKSKKVAKKRVREGHASSMVVYFVSIALALSLVVIGFMVGSKVMSGSGVGVIAIASAVRKSISKISKETESFNSEISSIISASASKEEALNEENETNSEDVQIASRKNLDTSDSAWERRSIFPRTDDG